MLHVHKLKLKLGVCYHTVFTTLEAFKHPRFLASFRIKIQAAFPKFDTSDAHRLRSQRRDNIQSPPLCHVSQVFPGPTKRKNLCAVFPVLIDHHLFPWNRETRSFHWAKMTNPEVQSCGVRSQGLNVCLSWIGPSLLHTLQVSKSWKTSLDGRQLKAPCAHLQEQSAQADKTAHPAGKTWEHYVFHNSDLPSASACSDSSKTLNTMMAEKSSFASSFL